MRKRMTCIVLAVILALALCACGNKADETSGAGAKTSSSPEETAETPEDATITIFAAKSLNGVVDALIRQYSETQPNVEVVACYDSSGTLMEQIREGAVCDLFFSAAQKQMDTLEEEGFLIDGTRTDVVNNQVCVVTYQRSETSVTGLETIGNAESFALADGSVPVGKYTRQAMVNAGMLPEPEDVSAITTEEVSAALGGMEINECANVGAVTSAVAEGSNEVGTVYKSDTYGLEDRLEILEIVSYDLTGDVIYPIAQVKNDEADEAGVAAARDFLAFLTSDAAKSVYESYYFDTNVK